MRNRAEARNHGREQGTAVSVDDVAKVGLARTEVCIPLLVTDCNHHEKMEERP